MKSLPNQIFSNQIVVSWKLNFSVEGGDAIKKVHLAILSQATIQKISKNDIYYLKNRGKREDNIARTSSENAVRKVQETQQRPKSLATKGSTKVETSEEGQIFDAIMGIDKELENAFG